MKTFGLLLLVVSSLITPDCLQAFNCYAFTDRNPTNSVLKLSGNALSKVYFIGGDVSYAINSGMVAFLSRKRVSSSKVSFVLDILNRDGSLRFSSAVSGEVISWLNGPSDNLVFENGTISFLTCNSNEHSFDINQISLETGQQQRLTLPLGCQSLRMVGDSSFIYLYSWNGSGLWRFSFPDHRVINLIPEGYSKVTGDTSTGLSQNHYFLVSGDLFRLEGNGNLSQVVHDGTLLPTTLKVWSADGRVLASRNHEGSLTIVLKIAEKVHAITVDLSTGKKREDVILPDTAVPVSVVPSETGTILYLDRASRSLCSIDPKTGRTRMMVQLKDIQPPGLETMQIVCVNK